jgi:ankyrin repeat protein
MYKGRTALHYAADYGQVEMISLLISKGAKVDAEDWLTKIKSLDFFF